MVWAGFDGRNHLLEARAMIGNPHLSQSLMSARSWLCLAICALSLSGCAMTGASGPGTNAITHAQKNNPQIRVIDVTDEVTRSIFAAQNNSTFARILGDTPQRRRVIGLGDVLTISIWEAPPAVLFTSAAGSNAGLTNTATTSGTNLPEQMVDTDGTVSVPFVGRVRVVGREPGEVGREISSRLSSKAHDPQTLVRIAGNQAADVAVVGDVVNSRRVPLTTKNERLLDALASAGGVRQPVDKVLIQITRGQTVVARPMGTVIREPAENIRLMPDDVVTALYQPFSFQALGAVGASTEVNFEGTGISLAQALGRVGGLQDSRANVKGLFIFRFEDPAALPPALRLNAPLTAEGRVPVIYRVDMSNPATFFVMQSFPIQNKDILYVSNAPLADLQKFVGLVSQLTFSVVGVVSAVP